MNKLRFAFVWVGMLLLAAFSAPHAMFPEAHRPLLGMHVARGDAAHLLAARKAGADFVVVVFSWRDIEPTPNYFYWEVPDAALRAAAFAGVEVVARLDRAPDWALDDASPTPWDLDAYAAFVRRVVQRYGEKLAGVILWNEPNLALEWQGKRPDAAAYAAMLAHIYPVVKEAAPHLPVAAAGLAFTLGDGANAINDLDYLRELYAAGAGASFDALAAHPYGFGQPPEQAPALDRLNFRRLELHRSLMEANGDDHKPIWITEMGWRTSAPDPADRWQVVTPAQQREYTLAAIEFAAGYPWLERMAFWELTAAEDGYGYALWQGEGRTTPAYDALVERHEARRVADANEGASAAPEGISHNEAPPSAYFCAAVNPCRVVEILAPDVIIRLGDRGELHPHWVHLYEGGERFSPVWEGEFFVGAAAAGRRQTLVLETMQIDQPTNEVWINGRWIARLPARTRPDPTSTWATARIALPAEAVQPGRNTIRILSGMRNPARSFRWWRRENFQFRHVRLESFSSEADFPASTFAPMWRPLPSPPGWGEPMRVRVFNAQEIEGPTVWLTENRNGQLWRGAATSTGTLSLSPVTPMHAERLVVDVAVDDEFTLAATNHGLFWRRGDADWTPAAAPSVYAHVVMKTDAGWCAGLEGRGLWCADEPTGRWRLLGLAGLSVLDLAISEERWFAATDAGVYLRTAASWRRLPSLPVAERSAADANYVPRLFLGAQGELVARSDGRLLRWDEGSNRWAPFGPEQLQGRLYAVLDCCESGAQIAGSRTGLWRLEAEGEWRRVDGGLFDYLEFTEGVRVGRHMLWTTTNGAFLAEVDAALDLQTNWRTVEGLPTTVTALVIDPKDAMRWLAGTPVGVYRSEDAGAGWQAVSPPWIVWDMTLDANGRLLVATSGAVVFTDDAFAADVRWRAAQGLEGVTFFTVSPDPNAPERFWAGTWGNDIGVSLDGGETIERLGAGLETLSILSILRHLTPGQFTVGAIEGLFRSDDGGASWFKLPGALSSQTIYALMQTDDGALWAGAADGLWRSPDYGATWERLESIPSTTVIRLGKAATPNGSLLWAGGERAGFWWSQDGGASWSFAGLAGRSVYALAWADGRFIAATDDGLFEAAP